MPPPYEEDDDLPAAEDSLLRTQRLASVGALTAGVAHQLSNRLGGILMAAQYATTALDREDARAVIAKALADIEADAKQCSEALGELRRFARHAGGERAHEDLVAIVRRAIELAEMATPRSNASVSLETPDTLPRPLVDHVELCRALVDVLSAARRSACESIRVAASAPNARMVRIRVTHAASTGRGDDPAGPPGEPSQRLALARSILEDHGGSLDVSSSATDGIVVTLQLPLPAES